MNQENFKTIISTELGIHSNDGMSYSDISIERKNNNTIVFSNLAFSNNPVFNNELLIKVAKHAKIETLEKMIFKNCSFGSDLHINCGLDLLKIENCHFKQKFYINRQSSSHSSQIQINNFSLENTTCSGNFKLHNCKVKSLSVKDSDFLSKADFFKSKIQSGINSNNIEFMALNFEQLALFGEVEFESFTLFKYVTFKGYVHFRNAIFKKGVDLDYSNIEKEINFYNVQGLDSKQSKQNTSQETYRIIKSQLKSIGNVIDSNKYHALEIEKKRENTPVLSLDYIVYLLHWLSSRHSQNWFLPIMWIFIIGIATTVSLNCLSCYTNNNFLEDIFNYISIINTNDCLKNNPIILLVNKVALGYLYYQFLTVVRKDTRI